MALVLAPRFGRMSSDGGGFRRVLGRRRGWSSREGLGAQRPGEAALEEAARIKAEVTGGELEPALGALSLHPMLAEGRPLLRELTTALSDQSAHEAARRWHGAAERVLERVGAGRYCARALICDREGVVHLRARAAETGAGSMPYCAEQIGISARALGARPALRGSWREAEALGLSRCPHCEQGADDEPECSEEPRTALEPHAYAELESRSAAETREWLVTELAMERMPEPAQLRQRASERYLELLAERCASLLASLDEEIFQAALGQAYEDALERLDALRSEKTELRELIGAEAWCELAWRLLSEDEGALPPAEPDGQPDLAELALCALGAAEAERA